MRNAPILISTTLIISALFGFDIFSDDYSIAIGDIFMGDSAESTLALGERLALPASGVYELELIKKVSDRLANGLLNKSELVSEAAKTLKCGKQHKALELVKGIGEKTAQNLASYLSPSTEPCKQFISAPQLSLAPSPRKRRAKSAPPSRSTSVGSRPRS